MSIVFRNLAAPLTHVFGFTGVAFDRRFAEKMIAGETKAIDIYKEEVSHGQNLDVRGYAEKALPVLETHLADAKKLEKAKPANKG